MPLKTPKKNSTRKKIASKVRKKSKNIAAADVQVSRANGARLKKLTKRQEKKVLKTTQRSLEIPKARVVFIQSIQHLYRHKKLFAGILLTYGLLYVLFVKGIGANFQLGNLKDNLKESFNEKVSGINAGIALYGLLLGTAGTSTNEAGGTYQTILLVIVSLALIWALRTTYGKDLKPRIRDSFYKGMYPLVPFLLVMLVIVVQLVPALITATIFTIVQNNGLAVGLFQNVLMYALLLAGLVWSFYMLSSSLFAMYIVTLPDTGPRAALKSARKLTHYRRWILLRKIFFLPVVLLLISAIVLIPLIILVPVLAEITFLLFTITILGVIHSYYYSLYRSLL